ncbi:hypothetical protein Trydic_g10967 [Trypoxylus dichotomus]
MTSDWHLSDNESLSDHKLISFGICNDNSIEQRQMGNRREREIEYRAKYAEYKNTIRVARIEYTQNARETAELLLETFFLGAHVDDEGHAEITELADTTVPSDRGDIPFARYKINAARVGKSH